MYCSACLKPRQITVIYIFVRGNDIASFCWTVPMSGIFPHLITVFFWYLNTLLTKTRVEKIIIQSAFVVSRSNLIDCSVLKQFTNQRFTRFECAQTANKPPSLQKYKVQLIGSILHLFSPRSCKKVNTIPWMSVFPNTL